MMGGASLVSSAYPLSREQRDLAAAAAAAKAREPRPAGRWRLTGADGSGNPVYIWFCFLDSFTV